MRKLTPALLFLCLGCGTATDSPKSPITAAPPAAAANSEASLEHLEASYQMAKKAHAERADSGTKKTLVLAAVEYANALKDRPGEPRQKYSKALALYELALSLEPKNSEARENRQQILSIYDSMGRKPAKVKI